MKIFKPSTLVSLGIAIAAALLTQPMRATPVNNIVITENSSTSLAVTYTLADGTMEAVTVAPIGAEEWSVTFPSSVTFSGTNATNWIEPENSGAVNAVVGVHDSNQALVISDGFTGNPKVLDDTTVANVGTDSSNGGSISITFDDDEQVVATTPDTGSTLGLLSLSVVALLGATRLRFPLKLG
jgi:hypothetical protein